MAPLTAHEVLILFSQALSSPADSEQQANILREVKAAIEADPAFLPVLYSTILSVAGRAGPLLKRWIADVVEFTVARLGVIASPISPEQRAQRELALSIPHASAVESVYQCTSVVFMSMLREVRLVGRWRFRERKLAQGRTGQDCHTSGSSTAKTRTYNRHAYTL